MGSMGCPDPELEGAHEQPTMLSTRILPVSSIRPPNTDVESELSSWFCETFPKPPEARNLLEAASALRHTSTPVAFPTETVYGLGADATRSDAVRGIYAAKQRPSDNPLIVHVASLPQLRRLLRPPPADSPQQACVGEVVNGVQPQRSEDDPIPDIYHPLIRRFWPGPLTILLPLPKPSPFAPEVNSNLPTFGVRMPSSPLARLLISLTDRPLAAPSANASGRPSPTTAQHVYHDLQGRIDIILDGGPCAVGVESTVVDGLCDPPAILRPGGVGIEEIRALGGKWADVTVGYRDRTQDLEMDGKAPRAPGMKYKHYAPSGKMYLFEVGATEKDARAKLEKEVLAESATRVGIVSTRTWMEFLGLPVFPERTSFGHNGKRTRVSFDHPSGEVQLHSIRLGLGVQGIAQGLFSALRDLDQAGCQIILIEGISDTEGDLAAAIMNRLRKAAEVDIR